MRKILLLFGIGLLSVVSYGQSADCAGATLLTVDGPCGSGTISDNVVNDAAAPSCGTATRDGWFRFVATGTTADVTAVTSNRNLLVQAFSSCGGAQIGCVNANTTPGGQTEILNLTGLTSGVTYYIRVVNETNNNMTLSSLCVTTPSANFNMSNTPVTTCTGTFYDSGGSGGSYANNEFFTKTFTPDAPCSFLRFVFTSFAGESCCDDLTIYDGPSTASPVIGTYGTNPGTITSTHPTGALTFVWDSDFSTTGTGWVANITCISGTQCAGTPSGGTAVATPNSINCSVTSSVLSATGLSTDCGISYQWQSAPAAGGPWTNIAGATADTYTASPSSNTYYRIVSSCANSGLSGNSASVLLSSTFSPPANDNCANAVSLTVNADYNCGSVTAGTVACASQSPDAEGCGGTSDDDVWYKFVATATSHRVSLTNVAGSTTDMYHSIYSGACGSLTELNCNDADVTNLTGLTIGATYYVRVYTWTSTGGQTSTFNVCIGSPPPPPSNDAPCSSILATVNSDLACGIVTAGTTTSATNSGIAACAGTADDDVWFSFVATSTVHNFDLLNITGTVTNMVHEIFSGACGSLSSVACSDPNSSQFSGFTIGQTYFIRVYTNSASAQTVNFDLCIGTPPPPPSNDEPCGAIDLSLNYGSCAFQSAVLETTSTISAGMPAPGCSSLGADVWFKVTVPAGGLIIDLAPNGGPTDFGMAWYTGTSCSNLTTLVECDDDDSQNGSMPMICRTGTSCTIPGDCAQNAKLATGTVVYIRVWEYGGGSFGPFDICAYEPAPAGAPSTCASATNISSLPFSSSGETTCCRVNTYTSSNGCGSSYQDGEDFMYTYTPSANETIDITLTGTLDYTGIFITDNCPNAGGVNCVASATSFDGNPTLCGVSLTAGTTYYIMVDTDPSPSCTPFNINITSSSTPTCGLNYTPSVIAFAPDLNAGTNIALPIDDRFSSSYTPIGFTFCFDGYGFSQLLVSSNGYVIFDPIGCASNLPSDNAAPGDYSAYSISAAIPNTTNAPRNAILFPWQDINPAIGGTIRYQTLGTAPNRRFVLTFDQIPYYSCTSREFTGQLKLFETTNTIEMHITEKDVCTGWNGGDGIIGLHNFNGTVAVTNAAYNYPNNYTLANQAFRFTSNCGAACIILPVKLMSFTAKAKENYNVLDWQTSTEVNNDYFVVESSTDMINFKEIGRVDGAGNSNNVLSYQYLDYTPFEKVIYYRLKQVDFDGVYTFSEIVAVKKTNEGEVNIYPNPATEVLFLDIDSKEEAIYTIRYVNVLGATVQEKLVVAEGSNTYQLAEFKQLNSGIYFVQLINENNEVIKNQKIVKE